MSTKKKRSPTSRKKKKVTKTFTEGCPKCGNEVKLTEHEWVRDPDGLFHWLCYRHKNLFYDASNKW